MTDTKWCIFHDLLLKVFVITDQKLYYKNTKFEMADHTKNRICIKISYQRFMESLITNFVIKIQQ